MLGEGQVQCSLQAGDPKARVQKRPKPVSSLAPIIGTSVSPLTPGHIVSSKSGTVRPMIHLIQYFDSDRGPRLPLVTNTHTQILF